MFNTSGGDTIRPLFQMSPGSDELAFDLFVKIREIQQITDSLKQVSLLPTSKRQAWIHDHEPIINDMMESFMQDTLLVMDGMQLDGETTKLSIELITSMRDAMNIIGSMFADRSSDQV